MKTVLVAGCVCAGLLPATAAGARPARPAEVRAIVASARAFARTCCGIARISATAARVSTVDRDFAAVTIRDTGTGGPPGPRATVVLVHTYSGRWTVVALGTARLACGISGAVRKDLGLPRCR